MKVSIYLSSKPDMNRRLMNELEMLKTGGSDNYSIE